MSVSDSNLDTALAQLERILGDQLGSINSLSTKASVGLGFVVSTFAAIFALSRDVLAAHVIAAAATMVLFISAAVTLTFSLLVTEYEDPPNPLDLLKRLKADSGTLKLELIANLADAYDTNKERISKRFRYLNAGLWLFILGVVVFVGGVVFL
jgi:hypothetical protein